MQNTIEYFRSRIGEAAATGCTLRVRGGGTKDRYGQALTGDVPATGGYSGILAYEPSELVITARSGTPLALIEAALAEHGQMLAFEPPISAQAPRWAGRLPAPCAVRAAPPAGPCAISCWAQR